ncbi:MAG: pilus assembly protein [Litoreibacter sp.]
MTLNKFVKTFLADESGAVTVDWVVLTAAIVGLGIAVMASISGGLESLSGDIQEQLETEGQITTSFDTE